MNIDKKQVLAVARKTLVEFVYFAEEVLGPGTSERLTGIELLKLRSVEKLEKPSATGPLIEKSPVMKHLNTIIDFLNTGIWPGSLITMGDVEYELTSFESFLYCNLKDEGGEHLFLDLDIKPLRDVVTAFIGRSFLEKDWSVSVKQLATAVGLAEKTIRMAAVGRDKDPDLKTYKHGNHTLIKAEVAKQWLATKQTNYRPTIFKNERCLPAAPPKTRIETAQLLRGLREKKNISIEQLSEISGWSRESQALYEELESFEDQINRDKFKQYSIRFLVDIATVLVPTERREFIEMVDGVLHQEYLKNECSSHLSLSDHQQITE